MSESQFEPKIIGFLCNWCSYRAADLAGTARIKHAPNIRIIRVMCSGRVDPASTMKPRIEGSAAPIRGMAMPPRLCPNTKMRLASITKAL